jgi:hypothetical protein
MLRRLLLLLALLAPSTALAVSGADVPPAASSGADGCISYAMCVAESTTGPCDTVHDGTGAVIVLRNTARTGNFGQGSAITFYAARSTSTTFTCDIYTNDEGYSAAVAAGDGSVITGARLTQAARVTSISGAPLDAIWINCSANSGGTVAVTINALVCAAMR